MSSALDPQHRLEADGGRSPASRSACRWSVGGVHTAHSLAGDAPPAHPIETLSATNVGFQTVLVFHTFLVSENWGLALISHAPG